jgi:hypothetical protein
VKRIAEGQSLQFAVCMDRAIAQRVMLSFVKVRAIFRVSSVCFKHDRFYLRVIWLSCYRNTSA